MTNLSSSHLTSSCSAGHTVSNNPTHQQAVREHSERGRGRRSSHIENRPTMGKQDKKEMHDHRLGFAVAENYKAVHRGTSSLLPPPPHPHLDQKWLAERKVPSPFPWPFFEAAHYGGSRAHLSISCTTDFLTLCYVAYTTTTPPRAQIRTSPLPPPTRFRDKVRTTGVEWRGICNTSLWICRTETPRV